MSKDKRKVYLVGAGPGDESLITMRAAEVLRKADCVIYDGLANEDLLRYVPETAERICVRKRIGPKPWTQPEIDQLLIEKTRQHRRVVRLKGGDPGLFGRAPEEAVVCERAGVQMEIVPGITAAIAAADYTGIFLTDREHSSQVLFMTGREAEGKEDSAIDYDVLARFQGTIVIYMGMGTLEQIADEMIARGKPPQTPVAVIGEATLPTQRLLRTELGEAARRCREESLGAPALVLIGPAARGNPDWNWFMNQPLFGKRIVITRDAAGNDLFARLLRGVGAAPIRFDGIAIEDRTDLPRTQEALARMGRSDWIVFTSANGVRHVFAALARAGRDARAFGTAKVACIGAQTADCLAEYGIRADFVPTAYTSEVMAKEMTAGESLSGRRIMLLRSEIAPRDLVDAFEAAGATVEDVPTYTVATGSQPQDELDALRKDLTDKRIDWITFTSSSTVRAFFEQVDAGLVRRSGAKIASIGPVASGQLEKIGMPAGLEAEVHTVEGLLDAMSEASA